MKLRNGFVSNSSTASFICQADFTVEQAKDILEKMLIYYRELMGKKLDFYDVFKEPRIGTKKCYNYHANWTHHPDRDEIIGRLIIQGADDNSIPFSLFMLIEEKFEAKHYHLG